MFPQGSGVPPNVIQFSSTCDATTGESIISFVCNKSISGESCSVSLIDNATLATVWSGGFGVDVNAKDFTIKGKPNGQYYITASNDEATYEGPRFYVDCAGAAGGDPPTCTIGVEVLGYDSPTSAGGWGQIRYRITGAADNQQSVAIFTIPDGLFVNGMTPFGNGDYSAPIPPVGIGVLCQITANEDPGIGWDNIKIGCFGYANFTIPAYAAPPVPDDASEWFAVGGLLPNPARLTCLVSSLTKSTTDPANPTGPSIKVARAGLHIELELYRYGLPTPFARVRKTVRATTELVDVARYLRTELAARYDYAPRTIATDGDGCFCFGYRYREVDADGVGNWVDKPARRYAVLAALPGALDLVTAHLADPAAPGSPQSAFTELTHWIGYPLEIAVLIPGVRPADLFLEHRYFDAAGNVIAIASWTVPAGAVGGLLRFPHIDYCLACAYKAESALVDTDRSFTGDCAGVVPLPPPASGGYLSIGGGRLKLTR